MFEHFDDRAIFRCFDLLLWNLQKVFKRLLLWNLQKKFIKFYNDNIITMILIFIFASNNEFSISYWSLFFKKVLTFIISSFKMNSFINKNKCLFLKALQSVKNYLLLICQIYSFIIHSTYTWLVTSRSFCYEH